MHTSLHASLQLCLALCDPMDCGLTCSSVHGILPGKNTGGGCHGHLQGIYLTQGSNLRLLHLLHWQVGSLPLVPPGKPWYTVALSKSHGCHHCHHDDSKHPHSLGAVGCSGINPSSPRTPQAPRAMIPRGWFSSVHSPRRDSLSLAGVGMGC